MKQGIALIVHSMRRARPLAIVMAGVLATFQVLLCLAASTFQESAAFGQIAAFVPDVIRQALGPAMITLMSFVGIVGMGYFHIAVIAALIGLAVAVATEPAAEIETRMADLIFAHPLARHWIVTRSVVLVAGTTALVLAAMGFGSTIGIAWLAPADLAQPCYRAVRSLLINLSALMLSWGGIAAVVTSLSRRRSVAGAITGVFALSSYLWDYLGRVWKPAARTAWLSPFHYYNAVDLIAGGNPPRIHLFILAAIACAGFGVAYAVFARRDL
jgi:ABC-2 type transport system permease protein